MKTIQKRISNVFLATILTFFMIGIATNNVRALDITSSDSFYNYITTKHRQTVVDTINQYGNDNSVIKKTDDSSVSMNYSTVNEGKNKIITFGYSDISTFTRMYVPVETDHPYTYTLDVVGLEEDQEIRSSEVVIDYFRFDGKKAIWGHQIVSSNALNTRSLDMTITDCGGYSMQTAKKLAKADVAYAMCEYDELLSDYVKYDKNYGTTESLDISYLGFPNMCLGHHYIREVKDASCLNDGYDARYCFCGAVASFDYFEKTNHKYYYCDGKCISCGKITSGTDGIHLYSTWTVKKKPTAVSYGTKYSCCDICGTEIVLDIPKLTPKIKLSAKSKTIRRGRSYSLKISGLAEGDYVSSVSTNKKSVATVRKIAKNQYKISGKRKGKATVTVKLKSGKKGYCKVAIK